MEKTLKVVNSLVEKGIIRAYAIGGGMAATYYGEPTLTYDLDLFVYFPLPEGKILLLTPVYDYLKSLGYKTEGEGVNIEGMTVQFLPADEPLLQEAVAKARSVSYNKTKARIVTLEHLITIMLQTFRPKDKIRLANLLELVKDPKSGLKLDNDALLSILAHHKLEEKWRDLLKET